MVLLVTRNILYHKIPSGGYSFQLIDNNRMTFCKEMSLEMRIKNLCRISDNVDLLNYILKRYATLLHLDSNEMQLRGCFYLFMYEVRKVLKCKLKRRLF